MYKYDFLQLEIYSFLKFILFYSFYKKKNKSF